MYRELSMLYELGDHILEKLKVLFVYLAFLVDLHHQDTLNNVPLLIIGFHCILDLYLREDMV
jgi:hypothetical protein